jgi:hypothetical protein|tara:strand:- start:1020 stop:1358 length:339 start_codon:yes stop_codon:yes gene_type:complete
MKVLKNVPIRSYKGEPLKVKRINGNDEIIDEGEVRLSDALWAILNNAPINTQNDSIQGIRLAKALDKASSNGTIELEDGVHDWITPIAETLTVTLFRLNGSIIYDLIKDGVR